VAAALGVAETTVKTHLGNVFGKTGTGRQPPPAIAGGAPRNVPVSMTAALRISRSWCLGAMPCFFFVFFDFFGNLDVVPGAGAPLGGCAGGRIAGYSAQFGRAVDAKPSVVGGR
jgi:hypothetical protein